MLNPASNHFVLFARHSAAEGAHPTRSILQVQLGLHRAASAIFKDGDISVVAERAPSMSGFSDPGIPQWRVEINDPATPLSVFKQQLNELVDELRKDGFRI